MFDKPIVELHEGVQKYYDHYKPVELQNIEDIKTWPKGFITDNVKKSAKGITKFNL